MKKYFILAAFLLLAGCASQSVIKTVPGNVRVYHGAELVGITPYDFWDRETSGYVSEFTLKKDGYKDREIKIKKDVLYVHRLFVPPLIGLPWLFGYDTSYSFELEAE